jgi:hypothetical protein
VAIICGGLGGACHRGGGMVAITAVATATAGGQAFSVVVLPPIKQQKFFEILDRFAVP